MNQTTTRLFELRRVAMTVVAAMLFMIAPNKKAWANDGFSMGDGSEEYPYEMRTTSDWNLFAGHVVSDMTDGKYYKLMRDLSIGPDPDLERISDYFVGTPDHPFKGHFNGNGHQISFIYISLLEGSDSYMAPFRYVDGAEIKNLWIKNVYFESGGEYAAGLIGHSTGNTTIAYCRVNTQIKNKVSGARGHGGVVGFVASGTTTINNCVFDGWWLNANGITTTGCGGFVGWVENGATAVVNNSLFAPATMNFSEDGSCTFARADAGATVTINNSFYMRTLGTVQGKAPHTISAATGVTVANAGTPKTSGSFGPIGYGEGIKYSGNLYAGLGDNVSLTIKDAEHYTHSGAYTTSGGTISGSSNPYTLTMPDGNVTISAESITTSPWEGAGTQSSPYMIATTDDLNFLAAQVNAGNDYSEYYFKVKNDITYEYSSASETETNYTPIGTQGNPFKGHFNGNNKCISGIRIYSRALTHRQGLFGRASEGAVLENIVLNDAYIAGYEDVGGIVGNLTDATVTNCHVTSSVQIRTVVEGFIHGGIVGFMNATTGKTCSVNGCTCMATLTTEEGASSNIDYGGIVGQIGSGSGTAEVRNNFLKDVVVPAVNGGYGVLASKIGNGVLTDNYYYHCMVGATEETNCYLISTDGNGYTVSSLASYTVPAYGSTSKRTYHVATEGSTVTLTPDEGKTIRFYVTRNDNGERVPVTDNQFTMPAIDVTVENPCIVADLPWSENFDDAARNAVHPCWDNSGSTSPTVNDSSNKEGIWGVFKPESDGSMRMANYYVQAGTALINSSIIMMPESPAYELSFDYSHRADCGPFSVKVSTDNGASFTTLASYSHNEGDEYATTDPGTYTGTVVDLANYAGETIILQFYAEANKGQGSIFIDNLSIHEPKVAVPPTDVIFSKVTSVRAMVSWTSDADSWVLQTSTDNINWSSDIAVTSNSYMLTNLSPDTEYYVRVKGLFPGYRVSDWSEVASFTAEINPIGEQELPYEEDFEVYEDLRYPECWERTESSRPYVYATGNSRSDSKCLYIEKWAQSSDYIAILPEFETSISKLQLSFWYHNYYSTGSMDYMNMYVGYMTDINDASTFVAVASLLKADYNSTSYISTDWISFTGAPNGARIALRITCNTNGESAETIRWWIDDLTVRRNPDQPVLYDNADNSSTISSLAGQTRSIEIFGRTLWKDGDWNTLCLPFNYTPTGDFANATIMELDTDNGSYEHITGFDNGRLYLNFKPAESIEAGKPYLIKWESGDNLVNPVFNNVTITNTEPVSTIVSNDGTIQFIGTYGYQSFTEENKSVLFLGTGSTLYYPSVGASIGAQRAYFQLNGITAGNPADPASPIKSFVLNFDDEATTISTPLFEREGTGVSLWYDLNGRKLNGKPSIKGIYINNGKKVVVK